MKKMLKILIISVVLIFSACSNASLNESQNKIKDSIENIENRTDEVAQDLGISNETVAKVKEELENMTTEEIVETAQAVAEEIADENSSLPIGVEVGEDGSLIVDKDKLGLSDEEDPGINTWCVPKEEFEDENEYGSIVGEIIGPTTFKEKEYCEAYALVDLGHGLKVDTTYYYTYGKTDVWVVTEIAGQTIEQQVVSE